MTGETEGWRLCRRYFRWFIAALLAAVLCSAVAPFWQAGAQTPPPEPATLPSSQAESSPPAPEAAGAVVSSPDEELREDVPPLEVTEGVDRDNAGGCTLTSHAVQVNNYDDPLFCIEAWFQDESPQERVGRVRTQIEAVISGRIKLESLGLRQGVTLDELLTSSSLPANSDQSSDQPNQELVGLVSNMPNLTGRDRLISLVTPLDVQLHEDGVSATAIAREQLETIAYVVQNVSDEIAFVKFDWGPYSPFRWRGSQLKTQYSSDQDILLPGEELLFSVGKANGYYNADYRGTQITERISNLANSSLMKSLSPLEVSEVQTKEPLSIRQILASGNLLMTVLPTDITRAIDDFDSSEAILQDASTSPPRELHQLAELYSTEITSRIERYRWLYRLNFLLFLLPLTIAVLTMAIFWQRRQDWWSPNAPWPLRSRSFLIIVSLTTIILTWAITSFLPSYPGLSALELLVNSLSEAPEILNAILDGIYGLFSASIDYLQNDLFTLLVIIGLTWLLLAILRRIVTLVAPPTRQKIIFSGIWVVVVALAVVVAAPHLPGAGTVYLAGVSTFAVLAFTLSAPAAIGNVVAGFILALRTDLNVGDWVCICGTTGELVEQDLFVHKIRTPKNVVVTLQNNVVLSSTISKFGMVQRVAASGQALQRTGSNKTARAENAYPAIAHTTVTLGYDVPWRKVHQVLERAANKTAGLTQPFVLQTSLDDYYVSYELNAYLDEGATPRNMPRIYSELHKHIQDECNRADIEILSPHYRAVRDGSEITIPMDDWASHSWAEPGETNGNGIDRNGDNIHEDSGPRDSSQTKAT